MKKLLLLAFVGLTIISCKKGENDPFMSLRSRDARMTGEWELESMISTYIDTYDSTEYKTTVVLEDGIITQKEFANGVEDPDETSTYSYTRIFEVMKKGQLKDEITMDGETQIHEGTWFWLDSDKNKSQLAFDFGIYEVDRLTNSEMVLKLKGKSSYNEDGSSEVYEEDTELTFKKK